MRIWMFKIVDISRNLVEPLIVDAPEALSIALGIDDDFVGYGEPVSLVSHVILSNSFFAASIPWTAACGSDLVHPEQSPTGKRLGLSR